MHCPYCGKIVPDGVRFCPSCGRQLPAQFFKPTPSPSQAPAPTQTPQPAATPVQSTQSTQPQASPAQASQSAPSVQQTPTPAPATASVPQTATPVGAMPSQVPAQAAGTPLPPAPGRPARPANPAFNNFSAEFRTIGAWRSILISLAFGVGASAILALIGGVILSVGSSDSSDGVNIDFLTGFILVLIHTCAGSITASSMNAAITLPAGLGSLALLLGTAFGAYMTAHHFGMRVKWVGTISSALVGVIGAIFYLLIGFIPLKLSGSTMNMMNQIASMPTANGASARTFFSALLITGFGALAGYALAQAEPDARNVFTAFHRWTRRSRGWSRVLAETIVVPGTVLLALSVILAIVFIISMDGGGDAKGGAVIVALIFLPTAITDLSTLIMGGALEASGSTSGLFGSLGQGSASSDISLWTSHNTSSAGTWILILFFVIFLATLLYAGCRAAARNTYDPAHAGWGETWQAPLVVLGAGLFITFLFCNLSGHGSVLGMSADGSVRPALWVPLLAAVWTFLIEVVGITFGQNIIRSLPGMWKFFLPGCVAGLTSEQATADARAAAARHASRAAARAAAYGARPSATPLPPTAPAQPPASPVPASPAGQAPLTPPTAPATPTQPPVSAAPAATVAVPSVPAAPVVKREHKPLSKTAKRTLIIIGCVAAVLVIFGATYSILCNTVFNPTHQVDDYMQAIADGNFDKASSLVNPGVSAKQGRLLTNAAGKGIAQNLRGDVALIRNARVEQMSDGSNGSKQAQVSYTLNGSKQTKSLQVVRDGTTALIFPKWRVSTPLVSTIGLATSAGGGSYTVNGIPLTSENAARQQNDGGFDFYVYPGKYTVSVPHSKYLTTDASKAVTSGSGVTFNLKPADSLQSDIASQVKSKIDACVAQPTAEPSSCDFNLGVETSDDEQTRNFKWSVESYPDVDEVSLGSGSDEDSSAQSSPKNITGTFSLSGGSVKVTYQDRYDDDDDWDDEDQEFDLDGSASFTITGDKLTIDLSNGE